MLELRLADLDLDRCRCFFFLQSKLNTDFKEKFILLLRFDSKHVVLVVAKLKFRGFSEAIEALIAVEGSTGQSPSRLAPIKTSRIIHNEASYLLLLDRPRLSGVFV